MLFFIKNMIFFIKNFKNIQAPEMTSKAGYELLLKSYDHCKFFKHFGTKHEAPVPTNSPDFYCSEIWYTGFLSAMLRYIDYMLLDVFKGMCMWGYKGLLVFHIALSGFLISY